MTSFSEQRKKIEVSVPEDMTQDMAQKCLLIGMRTYAVANTAGLCVSHGMERGQETSLKMMSFKGEYAAAIAKFCEGVYSLQEREIDKNLMILKKEGSSILRELQEKQDGEERK